MLAASAVVVALLGAAGCAGGAGAALVGASVPAVPSDVPRAGPTPTPCVTPTSTADLASSLPGDVEAVAQVHVTGRALPSGFGAGDGSWVETSAVEPLLGSFPHGLRLFSHRPPGTGPLPEGEYVLLLGAYDNATGVYFTVGGNQGAYALRDDGLLHQRCVVLPGDAGPAETAGGISRDQLLALVEGLGPGPRTGVSAGTSARD
ncbi:hypothetical protein ACUN7V_16535 [Quadrisphaera oryzae]|uniref:hypothetical protein n=1 Tax=Quadrisphaera TaxID=317661 RepID=UPI0016449071|nr:hypothetical protein [Quadrisphaera sp. RL12-1S]MBC3760883.1 hypothetical protein [Quadrisphaera sp. RL12-1S]